MLATFLFPLAPQSWFHSAVHNRMACNITDPKLCKSGHRCPSGSDIGIGTAYHIHARNVAAASHGTGLPIISSCQDHIHAVQPLEAPRLAHHRYMLLRELARRHWLAFDTRVLCPSFRSGRR